MTDFDLHEELINSMGRCAYLVAKGDDTFSEAESDLLLGDGRTFSRAMLHAREAVELLEKSGDIKEARGLYDSDQHELIGLCFDIFGTYLVDVQDDLVDVKCTKDYFAVLDRYADKIKDKYHQLVTISMAKSVASADGDMNRGEIQVFNHLLEFWGISRQEFEFWYGKYIVSIVFGHVYDADLNLEDFTEEDLLEAENESLGEEGIKAMFEKYFDKDSIDEDYDGPSKEEIGALLAQLLGANSIEELVQQQQLAEVDDLPDIYQAVACSDEDRILELIKDGESVDLIAEICGIGGLTPLMIAAEKSTLEVVKILVENGANVNAITDEHHHTPLIWAIKGENENIAKYLINKGANIEPAVENEADWSPLAMAADHHLVKTAKLLLAKGADPNWRRLGGATPIKDVANQEETEEGLRLVKLLLKNKADPNLHDDQGFYPIHNAIDNGNHKLVELLLNNGVPAGLCFPEDSDEYGSLLRKACNAVSPDLVALILSRLSDENFTDTKTPPFLVLQEDGIPEIAVDEKLELIASTLLHGFSGDSDRYDLEETLQLICDQGVKPDLMGLCYAFLIPGMAKIIIPNCKKDLEETLEEHPGVVIAMIAALVEASGDGFRYYNGLKDLWFNAIKVMQACEVDVPEEIIIEEGV